MRRSKRSGQSLLLLWNLNSWAASQPAVGLLSGCPTHLWHKSPHLILSASATLSSASLSGHSRGVWAYRLACTQLQTCGAWPCACLRSAAHQIPGCPPWPPQAALPCCGPCLSSGKMTTNHPINKTDATSQAPKEREHRPPARRQKADPRAYLRFVEKDQSRKAN